ncbi:hypothetical protein D3C83_205690 [compost metagenome]
MIIAMENPFSASPPNTYREITTNSVEKLVIKVRDNVWFTAASITSDGDAFRMV